MTGGKKCCVIGAGISGLATTKEGVAQGLDVTCFERGGDIAGLWKYRPDVVPGQATLYDSLHLNSSKEMSCFSDFPFPKSYPNFMHHSFFNQYIRMYAERFGLRNYIQFRTEVERIVKAADFDTSGQWLVTVKEIDTDVTRTELFDNVVISHGHDYNPHIPQFPGMEEFTGNIIHSHSYKNSFDFHNQRVLVVGFGHSGAEIASQLAKHAKQVYLSSRSGTYITTRTTKDGRSYDQALYTRFRAALPYQLRRYLEYKDVCYQDQFGIQPNEPFTPGVRTISDDFLGEMVFGRIIVKDNIDHLKGDSIVFTDKTEENIDTVIMATGYEPEFPMLSDISIRTSDSVVPYLHKLIFPTYLEPCTLAFVGMLYSIGSRTPTVELQARWVTGVFTGKLPMPSVKQRVAWREERVKELNSLTNPTEKKALSVAYVQYLKDIATEAGCNPNLIRIMLTDPYLWYRMVFKPLTPTQWRIHGPGCRPQHARETILNLNKENLYPYRASCAGSTCTDEGSQSGLEMEDDPEHRHVPRGSTVARSSHYGISQDLSLCTPVVDPEQKNRDGSPMEESDAVAMVLQRRFRILDYTKKLLRWFRK